MYLFGSGVSRTVHKAVSTVYEHNKADGESLQDLHLKEIGNGLVTIL